MTGSKVSTVCVLVLCALLPNFQVLGNTAARSYEAYRPSFRFPSRPKIINNQYEDSRPDYSFIQHYPNPLLPAMVPPQYGPLVVGSPVECVCPCTKEYLPICGSDGRSYGNNCLFQCQRKCDPGLRFKYCGTCDEPREDLKLPCF